MKRSNSEQKFGPKIQNPPSIPSHLSVFGYEENETGQLIKQRSNQIGFTGEKHDKVGPGDYEIGSSKNMVHKTVTGVVQWKKPIEKPVQVIQALKQTKKDLPGPGEYNVTVPQTTSFTQRPSSMF